MTQRPGLLTRTQLCNVGWETAFGVPAPHPRRLYLRGAAMPLAQLTRDQLARDDAHVYQHQNQADILGLQTGGPVKLPFDCKSIKVRLDKDATPPLVTDAAALSHQVVLHHAFGAGHAAPGGVVVSATTSALTLDTDQGANFIAGQICIPQIAGVDVPRIVQSVAGDVVTVWPALPSAPATGQLVFNAYSFARAEAHSSTLSVETAHTQAGATETQRRGRGIAGQIAWTGELRKLAMFAYEGNLQAWDDDGDLALSVVDALDDMGPAMLWNPTLYLWDNTVSTNPAATNAVKTAIAVPNKFSAAESGGAVEGASAKFMTSGRDAPCTFDLTTAFDRAYELGYAAKTQYAALLVDTLGTGAAQRTATWFFPNLSMTMKPERVDAGGLAQMQMKFKALANDNVGGSPLGASSTDFSRSPVVFAIG